MRSKILKTIGILFAVLVLAIAAISFFLQTDYPRNIIKNLVEKAVSSATKQAFTIGEMDIDLIRGISLKDVSFRVEGEPFVFLGEASVKYSLSLILNSSMLFSKVVPVNDISIRGLKINLIKDKDGNWNFSRIGRKKDKKDKDEKETKEPPKWTFILRNSLIKDAQITVENRSKKEVTEVDIKELDFSLNMFNITKRIELRLKKADLEEISPRKINIKGLSARAVYTRNEAEIKDLEVNLNGAKVKFVGRIQDFKEPQFKFKGTAYGFKIKKGVLNAEVEGRGLYKSPENIQVEVKIKLPDSEIRGKKVWGSIESIKMAGTKVEVRGGEVKTDSGEMLFKGSALLDRILKKEGVNRFDFNISLKDIEASQIIALIEKEKQPDILNREPNAKLSANLNVEGRWKEKIEELEARVNIDKFHLKGDKAGLVDLKGLIEGTKSDIKFDLGSNLSGVNLALILNDEKYSSNINSNLNLRGSIPLSGDLLDRLAVTVQGEILPSTISGINLRGGQVNVSYKDKIMAIKSLYLTSDSFELRAKEAREVKKGTDFNYEVTVKDLNFISKFSTGLDLKGSLKADGRVSGEIKKPQVTLSATVSGFGYKKDIEVKSIDLKGSGMVNIENPQLDINGNLKEIKIQDRNIESASLQARSRGKEVSGSVSILENAERSYEVELKLADLKSEERNLAIQKIKLNLKDKVVENKETINLISSPKRLIVRSFNLYYGGNSISGDANIDFDGAINADLELSRINFSDISQVLEFENPLQGIASGKINLQGTLENPRIEAGLNALNLQFREFKSDSTNLNLSYLKRSLSINLGITENSREILSASGRANVDLNFKKIEENLKEATFDFTLESSGVDLSPIAKLNEEIKDIHGIAVIDLRASGSIKNPNANGQIRFQDVSLRIHSLGNEIKVTNGLIEMQGQKGLIRNLEIETDGGRGNLEGNIDLSKLSYNIRGKMDNLQIQPRGITARLYGNIEIKGSNGKTNITGNVKVRRGRIKIPDLPTKGIIEEIKFVDKEEEEEEFTIETTKETDYFKDNVAMGLKVSIPSNTWVRGRGANIEIKGKVGVNKKYGEPIIITGNIDTVRGTYDFLGKLFKIEEGTVSFAGTQEINPFLDLKALYRVSDVDVFVNIRGTAKQPNIKLSSDPPMEETDIFSYLLFGTSSDKLGARERFSLQQKAGEILGNIAVGELKGIVGEKFALDVISVTGGESGPQIEIGKYLTADLYIAYERGSTQSSTTIPTPTNNVRVEYRLFDFLTLESEVGGEQAGGDVFLKFDYSCPFF